MAILGKGVLAIWNGMKPGFEAQFTRWHVEEHIPERVGLPGFERGRRYIAVDGHPKFFNFYETTQRSDLESPTYKERLNNPTPWTLDTVKHFTDTSRTLCDVKVTRGIGQGPFIETIALDTTRADADLMMAMEGVLDQAAAQAGIVGLHLLRGHIGQDQTMTEEKKLRGVPDQEVAWLLLVEAIDADPILNLRSEILSDKALHDAGFTAIKRGLYRLQFCLSKHELQSH